MKSRRERGFTLIELGIVIGVIAVLVTVVVIGRGFIQTSQASKTLDAIDVIRKGAATISGMSGGAFPAASTANEMPVLVTRGFIPANPWTPIPNYTINNVQWSTGVGGANRVGISITCPAGQCVDVWNAYARDPNLQTAGNAGTLACTTAQPAATATALILCFQI